MFRQRNLFLIYAVKYLFTDFNEQKSYNRSELSVKNYFSRHSEIHPHSTHLQTPYGLCGQTKTESIHFLVGLSLTPPLLTPPHPPNPPLTPPSHPAPPPPPTPPMRTAPIARADAIARD